MELTEFIKPENIWFLSAESWDEAVPELLLNFQEQGGITGYSAMFTDYEKRETIQSCFAGRGLAYPHCVSQELAELTVLLGISRTGIPCDSPDNLPVHIIVLTVSSEINPEAHSRFVSIFQNMIRNSALRAQISDARTTAEIMTLIHNWENEQSNIDEVI